MKIGMLRSLVVLGACVDVAMSARTASAQAWNYPAFQMPTVSSREYTFGVAFSGDPYGTTGVAQWRQPIFGPTTNLEIEAGITNDDCCSLFLFGGALVQQFFKATEQTPVDLAGMAGFYGAVFNGSLFRVPIGIIAGHRFRVSGGKQSLTPYIHPRISIDFGSDKYNGTNVNFNFDLGADWGITQEFSLRGAFTFGGISSGSDKAGFGIAAAFRPGASKTTTPSTPSTKPTTPP